jgi:Protein of unknown function (DUF433)
MRIRVTNILEDFPDLELADIQACLLFAARRTDFPTVLPDGTDLSLLYQFNLDRGNRRGIALSQ